MIHEARTLSPRPAPVRVAHVCGGTQAGSTRVVLNLLRRGNHARFAGAICFYSVQPADADVVREVTALGHPHREVVKRSRYDWSSIDRLAHAFAALRADVVVLHGFSTYTFGAPAARQAGAKAVVRVEHSPELYTPLHRLAAAVTAPCVDSTVLVSHYLARYCDAFGITLVRPEVVHNGIDLAPFEAIERAPFAGQGPPVVLMCARLDTAKDHDTLLMAVARLRRRGTLLRLRLAGEGPLRGALEARAAALGLSDMVEFLGYRTDLPALYAECDVVALATHLEGFGLAVVEGMAAARPIVATRVAAIPELVEDGAQGLLVAPGDPEGFADALAALLADRERAVAMGAMGRARARALFALDPSVRAFEAHLAATCARVGLL